MKKSYNKNKEKMIEFKNQQDILKYLSNNSKHYTPEIIIDLIHEQIKDIDFTGKTILETSVGEGHLIGRLVELNPTMKKAHIDIFDLEDYNINISRQRLELLGCENVRTFIGDFMSNDFDDPTCKIPNKYNYCFQNPPYGKDVEVKLHDRWREELNTKITHKKTPESLFLYAANSLAEKVFSVLPLGLLFRGSIDQKIRKKISETLESLIVLPDDLFENTTIKTCITYNSNESNKTTTMIDASELFIRNGNVNTMNEEHKKEIIENLNGSFTDVGKSVNLEEIKNKGYSWNSPEYIKIEEEFVYDFDEEIEKFKKSIDDLIEIKKELFEMFKKL